MSIRVSGDGSSPAALAPATLAMLGGLVFVLVAGFLVLVLTNHDTGTYTLFVAGPLVTTVIGGLVANRVKVVEEVARTVEAQTNGLLSASIADIHEHLDQQTEELMAPAVTPPAPSPGRQPPAQREKPHTIVHLPAQIPER